MPSLCSTSRRTTSVVMPVYSVPSAQRRMYTLYIQEVSHSMPFATKTHLLTKYVLQTRIHLVSTFRICIFLLGTDRKRVFGRPPRERCPFSYKLYLLGLYSIIHSIPYVSRNIPKYVPHGLLPIGASSCPPAVESGKYFFSLFFAVCAYADFTSILMFTYFSQK